MSRITVSGGGVAASGSGGAPTAGVESLTAADDTVIINQSTGAVTIRVNPDKLQDLVSPLQFGGLI